MSQTHMCEFHCTCIMAKSLGRYRCHEVGIFPLQTKMVVFWKATKESALSCCSMANIIWLILSKTLIDTTEEHKGFRWPG